MKKIFSLVSTLLLICQGALAGPVDQAAALKLANNFLGSSSASQLKMNYKAPYRAARANKAEQNLYYVFNRGNDQGYVVVAYSCILGQRKPYRRGYTKPPFYKMAL